MGKAPFKVTDEGKEYDCYREITGVRVLKQSITVPGHGYAEDKDFYGNKYKPIVLMEHNANMVALDIIKSKNHV